MTSAARCPVCPSSPELRQLDPHLLRAPLQRCDTCLGLLATRETVAVATEHYHEHHYVMAEGHGRHACRGCSQLFDGARERCPACRLTQAIHCTQCWTAMALVQIAGVTLDVCWACRSVWFDRGELGLLARRHGAELRRSLAPNVAAGFPALDALDAVQVVDAADTALLLVEVAPAAAKAAIDAASATGEVAVAAVEVLLSIVGDIF